MKSFRSFDRATIACGLVAIVIGIKYTAVIPPLRVPDEEGHFLRAAAIAQGDPQPKVMGWRPFTSLPKGTQRFVSTVYKTDLSAKYTLDDLRLAASIPLQRATLVNLPLPAWYSPVPYVPQAMAALIGRAFDLRPIVTFYAGRIVNLIAAVFLVMLAMTAAPNRRLLFATPALLPMTLYEFASWSADAVTIGAAFLLIALLIRAMEGDGLVSGREVAQIAACAFALGLCKPVYFLIALMALGVPRRRFSSRRHQGAALAAILSAVLLGTLLATLSASRSYYRPRPELPIDPAQQVRCIRNDPMRYLRTTASDFRTNGWSYAEQAVGRLGLMDLKIPFLLRVALGGMLLAAALAAAPPLTISQRLLLLAIALATAFGISLSQYLVWTTICSDAVEGIQGRYFLPIVPLLLAIIGIPRIRLRVPMPLLLTLMVIANAIAAGVLVHRYWIL